MAETAYTLDKLYALPVYTISEIHTNIGRIKAARDLRFIRCIGSAVWGGDDAWECVAALNETAGAIFEEMTEEEMRMTAEERKQIRSWQQLRGLAGG